MGMGGLPLSPHRERPEECGSPARRQVAQRCSTSKADTLNDSCTAFHRLGGKRKRWALKSNVRAAPVVQRYGNNTGRADRSVDTKSGEIKEEIQRSK